MPHRIIRSWYTGRWWVGCYIWYSEERTGRAAARPVLSSLYQMQQPTNYGQCTNHYIANLLYDGPLLCGFTVAIKGLNEVKNSCSVTMYTSAVNWRRLELTHRSLRNLVICRNVTHTNFRFKLGPQLRNNSANLAHRQTDGDEYTAASWQS